MRPWRVAIAAIPSALALLAPATAPGQATDQQTSLPDIEDEVMCPVCGTTLELAAWLLPGLPLALDGGAIAFGLWRARGGGGGDSPPLDKDERERLDADIASSDG